MARFIREETGNGLSIVRTLIHTMEAREDPYKPHHNLEAAKQLTDNGFPPTGDLLCAPDCSHHAPAHPEPIEGDGTSDSTNEEFVPDPGWVETLHEIKRMEDEGIIPVVEYDPFNPKSRMTGTEEQIAPYAAKRRQSSGRSLTFRPNDARSGPRSKSAGARSSHRSIRHTPKKTNRRTRNHYER